MNAATMDDMLEEQINRFLADDVDESRLDGVNSWLSADKVDSAVRLVQKGGKFALAVVKVVGKSAEAAVPFIGLANLVVDELDAIVSSFTYNNKQVNVLVEQIKPCAAIVNNEMLPLVRPADKGSFRRVAVGCLSVILRIRDKCIQWKEKGFFSRVWNATAYEGKFKALQEELERYRKDALMSFLAAMHSYASEERQAMIELLERRVIAVEKSETEITAKGESIDAELERLLQELDQRAEERHISALSLAMQQDQRAEERHISSRSLAIRHHKEALERIDKAIMKNETELRLAEADFNNGNTEDGHRRLTELQAHLADEKESRENLATELKKNSQLLILSLTGQDRCCPSLCTMVLDRSPGTSLPSKAKLYFVCAHSFLVVEPPIEIVVDTDWLKKVSPILNLTISIIMKMCGVPLPSLPFDLLDDPMAPMALLNELLGPLSPVRLQRLSGEAYRLVAEKARQDLRWRDSMEAVFMDGELVWVKREYAEMYQS